MSSMSTIRTYQKLGKKGPSIFALLVDDISNMSSSKQKLLWMQINKEKLSSFAQELDGSVTEDNLTPQDIDSLIQEAKRNAGRKKKS